MEISHEEFITILKEKDEKTVSSVSEKLKEKAGNMRQNSVNSRT